MKKILLSLLLVAGISFAEGSRESDSLVLVALLQANPTSTLGEGGQAWNITEPIDTWAGVRVMGDRVAGLSVANRNQSLVVPAVLGDLTELKALSLGYCGISSLPVEIGSIPHLSSLNLAGNPVQALPGLYPSLSTITLGQIELPTGIPSDVWRFVNLTQLQVVGGGVTELSPGIGNLTKLQMLHLDGNRLTSLPPEIGLCKNLSTLSVQLRYGADHSQLSSLPSSLWELTELNSLYLAENQLTSIPAEISKLTSLRNINLSGNQLTDFPAELFPLTKLISIHLARNLLTDIPDEIAGFTSLVNLSLEENELTTLPASIGNCTEIQSLSLNDNSLVSLPSEITAMSPQSWCDVGNNRLAAKNLDSSVVTWLDKYDRYWDRSQDTAGVVSVTMENPVNHSSPLVHCEGTMLHISGTLSASAELTLFSISGREIARESVADNRIMALPPLASGSYIWQLTDGAVSWNGKISFSGN